MNISSEKYIIITLQCVSQSTFVNSFNTRLSIDYVQVNQFLAKDTIYGNWVSKLYTLEIYLSSKD